VEVTALAQIERRAASDAAFGNEIRTALKHGGICAAAKVARAHGFDVPVLESNGDELSDLELELVAGGKDVAAILLGGALLGFW
jgi:hypothetical protein